MRTLALAAAALLLTTLAARRPARQPVRWEPVGLSGGGAMFTPAISPVDPQRMLVNCDMSAAYLSEDGARSWRMLRYDQLRSNIRCRPAFHPTDARTVFAAGGWDGMKVSRDGGATWEPIGGLRDELRGEIRIDPDDPRRMLAGTAAHVFRSADGGATWTECDAPRGEPMAFHFDRTSPPGARVCFAATNEGIWRSRDAGRTWESAMAGLPPRGIQAFAGGSSPGGEVVLYCAVPGEEREGRYAGGIYRSTDRGDTWQPAMGPGLNVETRAFDEWAMGPVAQYLRLATSDARPRTVYALNSNTGVPPPHHASVYRSDDAGGSWRPTFQADPRFPGCNVEPDYTVATDGQFYQDLPSMAACSTDPDRLLLVDGGRCYITSDGGRSWRCGHTRRADAGGRPGPDSRWVCNGLVVTTTWNTYADPHAPANRYICYTDIGFARSTDRGATWQWWPLQGRAPWRNTCYELAFDPDAAGKVWGAFSNVHDIPNDNIISGRHNSRGPGGVCVSTDHALTWTPSSAGLPRAPVTSVVVDPRSPPGHRVLYAGVFGEGVYRSTDGGSTWEARNAGLGAPDNRRVCRVALHRDGTLFALVTAMRRNGRFLPEGVGLYRSRDGGGHWESAATRFLWPKDFTVDPRDSRTVYLGACDANSEEQGGLYRTRDGGATWTRIARKGPEHFGAYLHPARPGWIYATLTEGAPGAGLWLSRDGGATWQPMRGLPFANAQRVAVDPDDPDRITVTTFGGGVWRGPAAG
ncbi:MAG: hypothetical protein IT208_11180 [Chthonomonadales bacterium]|nr:hypothetical protein [Chthonomonadales bacterium]